MDISIVDAQLTDLPEMSNVIQAALTQHVLPDCSQQGAERLLHATTSESLTQQVQNGTVYFLAKYQQKIVGVIGMQGDCHLFHLFVLPQFHRLGIGQLLWQHTKSFVQREWHANAVTVHASMNAVKFYRQLGFEPVGDMRIQHGIMDVPMKITFS